MVNKVQERIFAETAAKLLAADWRLVDVPEPPDFEVWCGGERFGLEIRQIFVDQETDYGAPKKRLEAGRQRIAALLARRYYELGGSPLSAQFLGDLSHDKIDNLVKWMCRSAPRYPSSSLEFEAVGVKVFLTPLPANFGAYSRWLLVNDRVGWTRDIRSIELQHAVDKKAANLALYKQKYRSTALLLVADRTFNSGRMATSNSLAVQNPGFRAICLTRILSNMSASVAHKTAKEDGMGRAPRFCLTRKMRPLTTITFRHLKTQSLLLKLRLVLLLSASSLTLQ